MNTIQELSIEQQTNRQVKGWEIYNNGLIEQLNTREYLVKNEYIVEELTMDGEPSYICTCKDHQYRHVTCGHIIEVTFYQINNGA
jgi:exosome complex RNA-binding protein Rrp4